MARTRRSRLGALAFDGWEYPCRRGAVNGRLAALLGALDGAMAAIETGMGELGVTPSLPSSPSSAYRADQWNRGNDHGTATIALLAGGAVKGGRVIADWPGLKAAICATKRDLSRPRPDGRSSRACCGTNLRMPDTMLATKVFPESTSAKPLTGLVIRH